MITKFKALFGIKPKPSLEDEAIQDARDLEEQILHDELKLIDQRFRIDAHRAKQARLIAWLQSKSEAGAPVNLDAVRRMDLNS